VPSETLISSVQEGDNTRLCGNPQQFKVCVCVKTSVQKSTLKYFQPHSSFQSHDIDHAGPAVYVVQ